MRTVFDKNDSLLIKGIAILMMMMHHCFLPGRWVEGTISLTPFTAEQICNIAKVCKICVSLFVFVSGFGLYKSFKNRKSSIIKWVLAKWISLLANFWFAVLFAWTIGTVSGIFSIKCYYYEGKSPSGTALLLLFELLGMNKSLNIPTYNADWWYMSAALIYILIIPVICAMFDKIGTVGTILFFALVGIFSGFSGDVNFRSFLPILIIGAACSKTNIFEKIDDKLNDKAWKKGVWGVVLGIVIIAGIKLYIRFDERELYIIFWNFWPVSIVLFSFEYLKHIPILDRILCIIGKYSMDIYLLHGLIRAFYLQKLIYGVDWFGYSIVILLGISLAVAVLVEILKKIIKFDYCISKLINKIVAVKE